MKVKGSVKGKTYEEWKFRINEIDNFLNIVKEKANEGKELSREILERAIQLKEERKKCERIVRCWTSTLEFMYEYFSHDKNPENENNLIPEGITIDDAPKFHHELTSYLDSFHADPTQRIAWSVPRGHAKSTYLSNMYPIYNIVYNIRKFIVILSETHDGAKQFTDFVNNQLKDNKKLREDFGELMGENSRENKKDNAEKFVTKNNVMVASGSTQKQLRGMRFMNSRPDLIILDDLESEKNTNTPELRQKNLTWYTKTVNPLGDPQRTGFIYMGTLVNPNGLLPYVMNRADFKSKRYSAIVSPPDRQDLWEEYESIYRDLENPDRKEQAEQFYFSNQEEMDKGVEVLWNDRMPYYKLIQEKCNVGTRAFNSEYLNLPYSDEDAIFRQENFTWYDDKDLYDEHGRLIPMDLYGFWDIAITGKGDYNAIITVGRDRRTGIFYVLDAWAGKVNMHEALRVAEQKILEYEHHTFGVETIQAQWSMFQQLRVNLSKKSYFKTRLKQFNPRTKKEIRIEALEPMVEAGQIRFKKQHRLLIEMLELFPQHEHDDLPDSLASCIELAGNHRKRMFVNKPKGW
ncbi:phage terminase large subunit [Bacillus cereus group sp. Bc015]|uniref:phage terminase large subunit n=1 Tax=Bacillus cereus group sp. Bc015 TaxID=3018123 RepID=UPI0022E61330|nr:phage terminase large subunit [Bacillus cereus group sp. Bc015]MDA2738388.1 phage terminase large subunit [Bacillus cereus group sp. Bc015]